MLKKEAENLIVNCVCSVCSLCSSSRGTVLNTYSVCTVRTWDGQFGRSVCSISSSCFSETRSELYSSTLLLKTNFHLKR